MLNLMYVIPAHLHTYSRLDSTTDAVAVKIRNIPCIQHFQWGHIYTDGGSTSDNEKNMYECMWLMWVVSNMIMLLNICTYVCMYMYIYIFVRGDYA